MKTLSKKFSFFISLIFILCGFDVCLPAETFNFIRVLKPYNNPPPSWDIRVAVSGEVVKNPAGVGLDTTKDLDPALLYSGTSAQKAAIWAKRVNYFHWPKNDGEYSKVNFYYHSQIPSYITDPIAFEQAVRISFTIWQIPTAALICDFKGMAPTGIEKWAIDYKNVVSFAYNTDDFHGFDDGETIAKTLITWKSQPGSGYDTPTPPANEANQLVDCDIVLNAMTASNYTWSLNTMSSSQKIMDIQSVLTHEIGHLFGIAHPFANNPNPNPPIQTCPTMYASLTPAFTNNLNMRTLEDYDKNCIAFLYPYTTDGNNTYNYATPITAGTYNSSITEGDNDWYIITLNKYDTIKVVLEMTNPDLDIYICYNPGQTPQFITSNYTNTNHITIYGAKTTSTFRSGSKLGNYTPSYLYEYVYAHTITQAGNYHILVNGAYTNSASNYILKVYVSNDGDGIENSSNKTLPIPTGDYMPDAWEILYGLNPTNINDGITDIDNDGLDNYQEYVNQTFPNNPDTDGDGIADGWEIQHNLNPISDDSDNDPDNDGLANGQEYIYLSNPHSSDTDNDGMPDLWETLNNTNVLLNDANNDPDNDGSTNLEEYNHNTNPHTPDTDNDGIKDGWEIQYQLNPLQNDASNDNDNDGMTNISEYIAGTNPGDSTSVFKMSNVLINNDETSLGPNPTILIQWNNAPNKYYEILYSQTPNGPFILMEEFLPGNEFPNGIQDYQYFDRGYPFPGAQYEGSLRQAPYGSSNNTRFYKIRIKN